MSAKNEAWCLRHLGNGTWPVSGGRAYRWPSVVRERCGFRYRTTAEARALLRGQHMVFVGNSVQRRTMYALVDLLSGENATRKCLARSECEGPSNQCCIRDSRKGYHDFQHMRVDVADGSTEEPMQGQDYCGVDPLLFEVGTLTWGSKPRPLEWLQSTSLEGWAFTLSAANASTARAAELALGRVAVVRTALRQFKSLGLGRRESNLIGPADASAGPRLPGTLLLRLVPFLSCAQLERCSPKSFKVWTEQLTAALRQIGFAHVTISANCIAACRRGPMRCEPGRTEPAVGTGEVALSFLFHESGLGGDVLDLVRDWGRSKELVGSSADIVVLAVANSCIVPSHGCSESLAGWGDATARAIEERARQPDPPPPMWLVREFAHTRYGYPANQQYASAEGAAKLLQLGQAGALPVLAYGGTRTGVERGAVLHPDGRGIHFDDNGRILLAQLLLNVLALRADSAWGAAHRRVSRTVRSRRSTWRNTQSRSSWLNSTSVAQRGYCELTVNEGNCESTSNGAWPLGKYGIEDLAQCVERCRRCTRCRYVSFSWAHDECGWFHNCRLPLETKYQGDTYQTLHVIKRNRTAPGRAGAAGATTLWR